MPTTSSLSFRLPDTLAAWPWPRRINPHYAEKAFNTCDFSLLACIAYPLARKGCDLINFLFVIDEYSDVADEKTAQAIADIVMDSLRNPLVPRPIGESIIGEITRQFWARATKDASLPAQRRFVVAFDAYLQSVVQQAADRSENRVRDVETYFKNRRENIGARPCFALLEFDMDLPDEVLEHPVVAGLTTHCIDMLILGNDMFSYDMEQAQGDAHNLVTVVMLHHHMTVQSAMDWIAELHEQLIHQFLDLLQSLPSWGHSIDDQVARYIDGLANWVRANDSWSFESQRYFGLDGLQIQDSRWVTLTSSRDTFPAAL
ncbi:hypothetical protein EUX98_g2931 [Antrodiella citrinella]|uniref:Terpene synthase n=1 Tax=Antrodiella citrinella TaxID=2447956 RepID=A0A4S4MXV6_9APHY|nr:hypothetical protein EUX98_g2931 [Antrodiella citrinella]